MLGSSEPSAGGTLVFYHDPVRLAGLLPTLRYGTDQECADAIQRLADPDLLFPEHVDAVRECRRSSPDTDLRSLSAWVADAARDRGLLLEPPLVVRLGALRGNQVPRLVRMPVYLVPTCGWESLTSCLVSQGSVEFHERQDPGETPMPQWLDVVTELSADGWPHLVGSGGETHFVTPFMSFARIMAAQGPGMLVDCLGYAYPVDAGTLRVTTLALTWG